MRHRHADAVTLRVAHAPGQHLAVVHLVAMGQHHALGLARGSRGVLNVGDIVGLNRGSH